MTIEQMPSHTHGLRANYGYNTYAETAPYGGAAGARTAYSMPIEATGGGKAHNNLQPYKAIYMWERTN